jgi:hypothetical protein
VVGQADLLAAQSVARRRSATGHQQPEWHGQ